MSTTKPPNRKIVTLVFASAKAADHFVGWFLDGGGEQDLANSAEMFPKERDADHCIPEVRYGTAVWNPLEEP